VLSARRRSLLNTIVNDEDVRRRNLQLLFRDVVFIDSSPFAFSDNLFQNDINDSKFKLVVTNSGDDHFINNIN